MTALTAITAYSANAAALRAAAGQRSSTRQQVDPVEESARSRADHQGPVEEILQGELLEPERVESNPLDELLRQQAMHMPKGTFGHRNRQALAEYLRIDLDPSFQATSSRIDDFA